MKIIWRMMTMTLVFIFCFSLLTGCGQTTTQGNTTEEQAQEQVQAQVQTPADAGTANEPEESAGDANSQETTLPISKEKVELTLWHPFPPFFAAFMKSPDDGDFYPELEKRTNVHIKIIQVSTETTMETFNLMVASGEYPDLIMNAPSMYVGGGDKAIKDNVIIRLNELIEKSMPNLKNIMASNEKIKKGMLTDEGNIATFPTIEKDMGKPDYGPFIRQDWLNKLGLQAPVTYDDYYNVLKAFKERMGAEAPLWMSNVGVPNSDFLVAGYGTKGFLSNQGPGGMATVPLLQVDGKVRFGLIEPGFKDYLVMINKWYTEGLFNKDFASYKESNKDPNEAYLANGKTGIWYADQWSPSAYKQRAKDPDFHPVAIADAVKNPGDKTHLAMEPEMVGTMNGFSISTDCKNTELAARWVDYWYSDKGSLLANYGIEGKAFNYVDGKPEFTDLVSHNPDGMVLNLAISKFAMQFGPFVNDRTRFQQGYTDDEKKAAEIWASNRDSEYAMPMGAVLNVEESGKWAILYGDISTYSSEMMLKFITGKEPISKFDSFVEQIKSMKIDECIAVYQSAYDRYKSRK